MVSPADHLPPLLSTQSVIQLIASLGLPAPTSVESLQVTAEYHSIYLLHFSADVAAEIPSRAEQDGSVVLVLRVSGRHLPHIKTLNEVGVMTWIREKTSIPIPAILRFDASENNAIGHEFTILEKGPGISLDKVYDRLNAAAKRKLVEQLTDYLMQIHSRPWEPGYVGGLVFAGGDVKRGPLIDETFWQVPDIRKYWNEEETVESLNPVSGPFNGYTSYVTTCLERYIYAIEKHPSLTPYLEMIPDIKAFISAINSPTYINELNDVKYVLAHRDLHFANIMCDPSDPNWRITAVLDWEFAGIVPATRWNPTRAFLWNGQKTVEAKEEQTELENLFDSVCKARGAEYLLQEMTPNRLQESMQTATNHIRAIVEVCPRGQAQDKVGKWRAVAEAAMEVFRA